MIAVLKLILSKVRKSVKEPLVKLCLQDTKQPIKRFLLRFNDSLSNFQVALKIIEVKSASVQRNLERESRIMKLLSHPHIVQLYEVIDLPERNATCLVLEFVEGGELFDYIINKEKLDEKVGNFLRIFHLNSLRKLWSFSDKCCQQLNIVMPI